MIELNQPAIEIRCSRQGGDCRKLIATCYEIPLGAAPVGRGGGQICEAGTGLPESGHVPPHPAEVPRACPAILHPGTVVGPGRRAAAHPPRHPPGCHRQRISDRIIFDKLIAWGASTHPGVPPQWSCTVGVKDEPDAAGPQLGPGVSPVAAPWRATMVPTKCWCCTGRTMSQPMSCCRLLDLEW